MRKLITICVLVVMAGAVGSAQADLTNGSFETGGGSLSGWTAVIPSGASTTVVSSYRPVGSSWYPTDGSRFAFLTTDGPGNYNTLFQSFAASSGDVLTFDVFFKTNDQLLYGNDRAIAKIDGNTLWEASVDTDTVVDTGTVGAYGSTGWTSISYTVPSSRTYMLEFGIANWGEDGIGDSYMGVDNVSVVPVPGAVLLGILGLGVAGLKLRKFV